MTSPSSPGSSPPSASRICFTRAVPVVIAIGTARSTPRTPSWSDSATFTISGPGREMPTLSAGKSAKDHLDGTAEPTFVGAPGCEPPRGFATIRRPDPRLSRQGRDNTPVESAFRLAKAQVSGAADWERVKSPQVHRRNADGAGPGMNTWAGPIALGD